MRLEGNRWFINDNKFSASFIDWVVSIRSVLVGMGNLSRWELIFGHGTGEGFLKPIYFKTAEEAFNIVDKYKDCKLYKDLIEKLKLDGLINE